MNQWHSNNKFAVKFCSFTDKRAIPQTAVKVPAIEKLSVSFPRPWICRLICVLCVSLCIDCIDAIIDGQFLVPQIQRRSCSSKNLSFALNHSQTDPRYREPKSGTPGNSGNSEILCPLGPLPRCANPTIVHPEQIGVWDVWGFTVSVATWQVQSSVCGLPHLQQREFSRPSFFSLEGTAYTCSELKNVENIWFAAIWSCFDMLCIGWRHHGPSPFTATKTKLFTSNLRTTIVPVLLLQLNWWFRLILVHTTRKAV